MKYKIRWTAIFETEIFVGPNENLDDKIADIEITQKGYVPNSFEIQQKIEGVTNQFYKCGICGYFHPVNLYVICKENEHRFSAGDLDEKFGSSWKEIFYA